MSDQHDDKTTAIIDGHGTGLVPSTPDPRDYSAARLLSAINEGRRLRPIPPPRRSIRRQPVPIPTPTPAPTPEPPDPKPLPLTTDLRAKFPPIWFQGGTNACTSSVADMHVYVDDLIDKTVPSHAATWTWTKLRRGPENVEKNVGAGIYDAIASTRDHGVVEDSKYPYVNLNPFRLPPPEVDQEGEKNKTLAYFRLHPLTPELVLNYLGDLRLPLAFGLGLWQGWNPDRTTGYIPRRPADANITGYHLMVAVGFKVLTTGTWLLIRNSWSTGWGVGGYAWMNLEDFVTHAFDVFAITSVESGNVAGTDVPVGMFR